MTASKFDIDVVTVSARVSDPNGAGDILLVRLSFQDPPSDVAPIDPLHFPIRMEMFDRGPDPLGQLNEEGNIYTVLSGDEIAGDGVFVRRFYFKSADPVDDLGDCLPLSDQEQLGGTFTIYSSPTRLVGSATNGFRFSVLALDWWGNRIPTVGIVLPVEATAVEKADQTLPCGPPNGTGGCAPGGSD
jgi:hypothetical protein